MKEYPNKNIKTGNFLKTHKRLNMTREITTKGKFLLF